jgi:GH18 family chitinase
MLVRTGDLRGLFAWKISQDNNASTLMTAVGRGLLGH